MADLIDPQTAAVQKQIRDLEVERESILRRQTGQNARLDVIGNLLAAAKAMLPPPAVTPAQS